MVRRAETGFVVSRNGAFVEASAVRRLVPGFVAVEIICPCRCLVGGLLSTTKTPTKTDGRPQHVLPVPLGKEAYLGSDAAYSMVPGIGNIHVSLGIDGHILREMGVTKKTRGRPKLEALGHFSKRLYRHSLNTDCCYVGNGTIGNKHIDVDKKDDRKKLIHRCQ